MDVQWEKNSMSDSQPWVRMLLLPLGTCVTWGQLLHSCKLSFLQNGDNHAFPVSLFWGLNMSVSGTWEMLNKPSNGYWGGLRSNQCFCR